VDARRLRTVSRLRVLPRAVGGRRAAALHLVHRPALRPADAAGRVSLRLLQRRRQHRRLAALPAALLQRRAGTADAGA
jgi:hypothetical protein